MSSEGYQESRELLAEETRNMHRAIVSLEEELEAIDSYQQRAEVCSDGELRAVLVHNKNEEIEHAVMILEWLRRHNSVFASNIQSYVDSSGPITDVETQQKEGTGGRIEISVAVSLGIGSLKGFAK